MKLTRTLIPILLLLLLLHAGGAAQTGYDAAEGTLPSSQGFWLFQTGVGHAPPTMGGGALRIGPTIVDGYQTFRAFVPAIDFDDANAVSLTVVALVIDSHFTTHPTYGQRAGFSIVASDETGRSVALDIAEDGVSLRLGLLGSQPIHLVDNTTTWRTFTLSVSSGVAAAWVDGQPAGSAAVNSDPYVVPEPASVVAFGDGTIITGGTVDVLSFDYTPYHGIAANRPAVSLATGGTQAIALTPGLAQAGAVHYLLGSATGTSPGIGTPAGALPLVPDAYLSHTLANPNNGAPLVGSVGPLDPHGRAACAVVIPAGLPANLAGLFVHHAAFVLDPTSPNLVSWVSGALRLTLAP